MKSPALKGDSSLTPLKLSQDTAREFQVLPTNNARIWLCNSNFLWGQCSELSIKASLCFLMMAFQNKTITLYNHNPKSLEIPARHMSTSQSRLRVHQTGLRCESRHWSWKCQEGLHGAGVPAFQTFRIYITVQELQYCIGPDQKLQYSTFTLHQTSNKLQQIDS